jgi:hypothetical protein
MGLKLFDFIAELGLQIGFGSPRMFSVNGKKPQPEELAPDIPESCSRSSRNRVPLAPDLGPGFLNYR